MKQYTLLFVLLLFALPAFCSDHETDSLLQVLDAAIIERPMYATKKQHKIDSLKRELYLAQSDEKRYSLSRSLFGKYRSYRMDSALWVANERVKVAKRINNPTYVSSANMNVSEVMTGVGMYKEALDILNTIDKKTLDPSAISYYYHLYHSTYTLMMDYAFSENEKVRYRRLAYEYKDSILAISAPQSQGYLLMNSEKLRFEGKYDEAIAILDQCYQTHLEKGYSIAIPACGLAAVYHENGNRSQEKKYLALSSIADVQSGVKEYISLWKLAALLYQEGDIERAYTYMKCSMEDAIFCNARYRTFEISELLPIINTAYEAKMKHERDRLSLSVILISLLSVILLATLIYLYRQMKKLSKAKRSMNLMNENLKQMNNSLNKLNEQLQESNQVKEEYIGYVFNLCSTYIDKMEDFRKMISRKIKAGQLEDLTKTASSNSFVSDELKEFFRNFDTIFLKLYPRFIEEFNSLLQENERIVPKEGELLTSELRVFALIRLGINDSSKIASFLHYSPQTVYNYRLKVRNKSVLTKEKFQIAIQNIG